MKLRIVTGTVLWTLAITLLHVWANVGFRELAGDLRVWAGIDTPVLRVGYLPVT